MFKKNLHANFLNTCRNKGFDWIILQLKRVNHLCTYISVLKKGVASLATIVGQKLE